MGENACLSDSPFASYAATSSTPGLDTFSPDGALRLLFKIVGSRYAAWQSLHLAGGGARVPLRRRRTERSEIDCRRQPEGASRRARSKGGVPDDPAQGGGFSSAYNWHHGRRGTLWEGRFTALAVGGDLESVLTVAAYIDLNAVRAGLCDDYPSSVGLCGVASR